jgi:hypothetical protein
LLRSGDYGFKPDHGFIVKVNFGLEEAVSTGVHGNTDAVDNHITHASVTPRVNFVALPPVR